MTKDEALKLAFDLAIMHHTDNGYSELRQKVRLAIKQALAAPVQPVGTYGEIYESMQALLRTGLQRDQQIYMEMKDKPLYTTPPAAQRQWVGLTDEEYFEIGQRHWVTSTKIELIHAEIEAKLKEKNT
jgi:hypothetical protein